MKHGRGTKGAAPASNVAGRSDAQGTLLPARPTASCHVDSSWFSPTRADAASTRADSPGIGPTRAWIDLNQPKRPIQAEIQKKKKKGAECTVWLISKPYFNPISHKRQNISSHLSSHFVSHFTCLCALCLCFVSLVAMRHSATQFAASIHSFFSSLSRILNSGIIKKLSILV